MPGPGQYERYSEQDQLDTALTIFVNGISGVFLGMAVLYLTMKIIALVAVGRSESEDKG